MTKAERQKLRAASDLAKVRKLIRHIRGVSDNCVVLGEKLIEQGNTPLGLAVIARGFRHDKSKFLGIEWQTMTAEDTPSEEKARAKLRHAIEHHQQSNDHHPEHWLNYVEDMTDDAIAEMVCDWKGRSEERGTSLHDWLEIAKSRYEITDASMKRIMRFVNLLCEKPFPTP